MSAKPLFSSAEQAKLRTLFPKALLSDLLEAFPGRTLRQIRAQAHALHLKRDTERARKRAAGPAPEALPGRPGRPRKQEPTPVLNAQLSARRREAAPGAVAQMVEAMRKLPAGHPRRLAYAEAARHGNGLDALHAWQQWPLQQKGGRHA